ncbi:MAG: GNAT family N-acetyltransferase [Desulfuromonadales bacterium]|jgi:ribosomal protein S18 acetylase RimI-like enzyme|nr:GNAT family N-acetyltransferase [Desulfuromonadales bacterium]
MLEFTPLTSRNYHEHEADVMASEEIFPENIREDSKSYLEAVSRPGSLAFVSRCHGEYAGNVVGFPPCLEQQRLLRLGELETGCANLIYLFNIVAMPQFQGQGVGKRMLQHFLEAAGSAGFSRVGGHFRGNGSLKNFLCLGGERLASFDDWFGTGECYEYCELRLA